MIARARQTRWPLQDWLLGALLLVWLSAQSLGLAHRTLHAHAFSPSAHAIEQAKTPGPSGPFAGHAHGADCLLYDHAGVADLLVGHATESLPTFWATLPVALASAGVVAGCALPFQARAPPFLR